MRRVLAGALAVVLPAFTAQMLLAQTGSTTSSTKTSAPSTTPSTKAPSTKTAPTIVTLVGCVGGTGVANHPFTLSKTKEGVDYRLIGADMRAYAGQRVEIAGGADSRRLKIVGGLVPSPNVAAQAGALDPARAVVAADPLSTADKSVQSLPEFHVRSVRAVRGSCGG